jgi:uncharacterized protein
MPISNITGPPVEGENFFGREKELNFAWNHIKKGNSLILSAPRRVGKSSFAKKMIEFAKNENWHTLEIDLEEIKSEVQFVKLLTENIQKENWWQKQIATAGNKISQILDSIKASVEYEGATVNLEWKNRKPDIYDKLKSLINHKEDTLIMVDEVTVLLNSFIMNDSENGIKEVEFFLNWLRSFRQVSGTKIRWIFCSSIGIDNFTNRYALSYAFNDVLSFPIGAFDENGAKNLIQALSGSQSIPLSDEVSEAFLIKIQWYLPFFLQLLFNKFHSLIEIYEYPPEIKTLDQAYQDLIESKELNTWDERLKDYNDFDPLARILLKHLSGIAAGESRNNLYNLLYLKINDTDKTETILSKLLYMLKNDGYLIDTHENKYTFRSPLLRDFWFNRFAK